MQLPHPRGPLSTALLHALAGAPRELPGSPAAAGTAAGDPLADEDLQLTLHVCYELHYQGFEDVDEGWEWHPSLLALRQAAERHFEAALRRLVPLPASVHPGEVPRVLTALVEADDGPQLSKYLAARATIEQFREFVMHRSIYHLREADPHTWAVPRLAGRAKAALVEIQADEYGGGRPERMHAELFRTTMRELGLDTAYGAHLDTIPAVTLATNNLMSLFGLHRRLLGAILGHLAVFEMTSSLPNRHYGNGLRRLGFAPEATRFYDEHVQADAVHEQIAAHDLCGAFCAALPPQRRAKQTSLIQFGAACTLALDGRFAGHLLRRWAAGDSSLRDQPRPSARLVAGALGA
ncbi:iron-containing redox enzyme family protein [Dactylosporangium sp. NPDC000555]|uniref:iron-containing redox enzyme family protein n=1 Tax=Dactylosporangium sp. NPDC000555 TaxID=3154260 RepID=UPI00332B5931